MGPVNNNSWIEEVKVQQKLIKLRFITYQSGLESIMPKKNKLQVALLFKMGKKLSLPYNTLHKVFLVTKAISINIYMHMWSEYYCFTYLYMFKYKKNI